MVHASMFRYVTKDIWCASSLFGGPHFVHGLKSILPFQLPRGVDEHAVTVCVEGRWYVLSKPVT